VVADEVKSLSQEITTLSEEMERKIGDIVKSVNASHKTLQEVATIDMTENIMVRDQIDGMMQGILQQNQELTTVLNEAAASSRQTSTAISGMVMSIQFEDKVSQIIGNTMQVLSVLEQITNGYQAVAHRSLPEGVRLEIDAELCDRITKSFKLSEYNKLFLNNLQSHQSRVTIPESIFSSVLASAQVREEEEIELF
jgi:methyl-accepting chemotaxis protein